MKNLSTWRFLSGMFTAGLIFGALIGILMAFNPRPYNLTGELRWVGMIFIVGGLLLLRGKAEGLGAYGFAIHIMGTLIAAQIGILPISLTVQVVALVVYGMVFIVVSLPAFRGTKTQPFRKEA